MRRSTISSIAIVLAACVACSGAEPRPGGPLNHGIIAGNHQKVVAAPAAGLPNAIVAALARSQTGKLELRVLPQRLMDFVVPTAYAADTGTVVTGSPVAGAVVCATDDQGMHPFAVCTNTDNNGHATFFFSTDTVAGEKKSEIRGTVNNEPAVFDTAFALVLPTKVDSNYSTGVLPYTCSPATFMATGVRDIYGNAVPYRIVGDGRITVGGDTVGTVAARTLTFDSTLVDGAFRLLELRDSTNALVGRMNYRVEHSQSACASTNAQLYWSAAGMNQTPP